MKNYYVYILASNRNGTLYIGITSNLVRRIWKHKEKLHSKSFTAKYKVDKLVYYEEYQDVGLAIRREKRLKEWHRKWKMHLIEKNNPYWKDLYETLCF